jgi:ABC-type branched-subunit amino acid transport system permease subunit
MLLAPTTGLDAGILTELVFFAFGAAAIGGFQSLPLTYAGGLAIGIGSSVLTKYITTTNAISALPATLPFVVLFVALLVIPKGRLIERGAEVIRPLTQLPRLSRKTTLTVATATITFLVVLPTWIQSYRLPNFTTALGYVILFMSLSLLVRTSGQISLCQITFAAVGTTTFAHAMAAGVPWLPAVLLGGLVAVPVGAVVAIPAIRLSGVYLAVATFGFALVVQSFVFPSFLMFPFSSKLLLAPRPHIFGLHTGTDTGYYYVVLIFAGLTCLGVIVILRSRLGRLLRGLADQPIAVDAHGANTNVTRVIVFCISAFMAGIGGAVIAPVTGSVTSDPFNYQVSLLLVAVLFVAGRRPIAGAFIAGALYIVVPSYITSQTATEWVPVAFGVGALVAACFGGGTSFITVMKQLHVPDRARHRAGRSKVQQRLIVSTEV